MNQFRRSFLSVILSLVLLPSLLLSSAPVAADSSPPHSSAVVTPPYYGVWGMVEMGTLDPANFRLELYQNGVLVDWTDANQWIGSPVPGSCPEKIEDTWVYLDQLLGPKPIDRSCFVYATIVEVPSGETPDSYRIKATVGRKWGQVTISTADAEIGLETDWFFAGDPTIYAPTIRLTHTTGASASTPTPPPPPPPPPAPPTLTVNTLPTQTEVTYLTVSGTATPGAAVRFEVGGHESSTYLVGEKGTFMLGTTLAAGENHLKVTATKDGVSTTFEASVTQAPKPEEPKTPAQP